MYCALMALNLVLISMTAAPFSVALTQPFSFDILHRGLFLVFVNTWMFVWAFCVGCTVSKKDKTCIPILYIVTSLIYSVFIFSMTVSHGFVWSSAPLLAVSLAVGILGVLCIKKAAMYIIGKWTDLS